MYTRKSRIYPAQTNTQALGTLQIQVVCALGSRPIEHATVQIFSKDNPDTIIEELVTDISGRTPEIELPAPPLIYSMEPTQIKPYSEYILIIRSPGLQTVKIDSTQILPYIKSIQPVSLPHKTSNTEEMTTIYIGPHYLFGPYYPKIFEDDIKHSAEPTQDLEGKAVIIPEFITVHDGIPIDKGATNYMVEYKDYIKNVVSCTIYGTWPIETIYANILAVQSFTLNRVYTNWYQERGYDFTITSSPAHDNLWIYGRNIEANINTAVDYFFQYYLSRPNIIQPILTGRCKGVLLDCPGMLSLWGSKFLGDKNYTALDILKYYYGYDMYINATNNIEGIAAAWPGHDLSIGSSGEDVKVIQNQLNTLAKAYPAIPFQEVNGVYDEKSENAVKTFQTIFNMPVTGMVDAATWYMIAQIYARITHSSNLCRL